MFGCENQRPCARNARYRIGVKHTTGSRVVYWHYCTRHFRAETRRSSGSEYFDVVDVAALS